MKYESVKMTATFEGCRLTAYRDSGGILTIGYGHTAGVQLGQVWTPQQALNALTADIKWSENVVNAAILREGISDVPQGVFDAMVDFTFNCGAGAFTKSGIIGYLTRKDWQGFCDLLSNFTHDRSGARLAGLMRRRDEEIALVEAEVPGFHWQRPADWLHIK